MSSATTVFVSDAHFGLPRDAEELQRRVSFLRFLESLHGIERLVIAGDLFQFWFDLGETMPKGYFDILEGLRQLRVAGAAIEYVAGNHDFWRSDFFRDELGVDTHTVEFELETQGRRILVRHGDGEGPGDHGYKLLKRVVRNPATVGVARALHPDLLYRIARRLDRLSHSHTSQQRPHHARLESAADAMLARGYDAAIFGHVHVQIHKRRPAGEMLVIGDWLELRSFVRLENGVFTPERWNT